MGLIYRDIRFFIILLVFGAVCFLGGMGLTHVYYFDHTSEQYETILDIERNTQYLQRKPGTGNE